MRFYIRLLPLLLCVITLAACSELYGSLTDTTLTRIEEKPTFYLDRQMMVGGVIVNVEQTETSSTLELMEWKLTPEGEPLVIDDAGRRFLANSDSPLDPSKYQSGRVVTIWGLYLGTETRTLGENPYEYPVFIIDKITLLETPYRYGIHPHPDQQFPYYVGPEDYGRSHPYDPGSYAYPYTPYSNRKK